MVANWGINHRGDVIHFAPVAKSTVLVVEDDASIREAVQIILELEGYDVVAVENGKLGLDQLKANLNPKLVLLDMMMPVMNGREFLEQVGKDAKLKKLPVVVLSATPDKNQAKGVKATLQKPTDLNHLLETIALYCA